MANDIDHDYPLKIREKVNAINLSNAIHLFLRLSEEDIEQYHNSRNKNEIKKLFNSLKKQYKLMYFHLKELTEETHFFCDSVYKHKKMYLVLQSEGKSGWHRDNLVSVFKAFTPYLNNSLFYTDDESEGFVDRYEIKNKKLVYKRVVESGSDIFTYLEKNEIDKEILYALFTGKSISLKKDEEYWKK